MTVTAPPLATMEHLHEALGDRYAIERLIGTGGMASVYLARDHKHAGRLVALKLLAPDAASAVGTDRFLREIRIAARLSHPHIVPVFDSGEAGGLLYFVMPYIEGETLRQRARRAPIPTDEALRIAREVATALAYAHAHDVVHRDIKPENIMLSGDEAVGYMSPEQAVADEQLDGRSDIYSLGCVLYEMLVGSAPSHLLTPESLRLGRITVATPDARRKLDRVPRGVERILARMLAPMPEERFQTAGDLVDALRAGSTPGAVDARSVAVLPFANLTGDPENDYFGDGLAEEVTHALARVRALRVASRTSAFAYRHQQKDARQIGQELGVAALLEGSVRRAGENLRITVRLVDTTGGLELWSEQIERPMREVFAVEDEIAHSVARALAVILSDTERRGLVRVPTSDIHAYECYLRGRQFLHETRRRSLEFAREMFSRGIEADPQFALAHAGIADCSSLLLMYYGSVPAELERADAASRRALELDPDLAEAHVARACALFHLGRHDDAAAEFQTAIRLDPTQFEARYFYGRQCFQRGEFLEAVHWFEAAARVREDYQARFFAAQSHAALGADARAKEAYRVALEVAERHLDLHPDDPRAATMCAVALCRLGEPARGLAWARRALEIDREDAGVRYNVACLYALEGERDRALATLEECVALGFGNPEWISQDPDLAALRDDPRFLAILASLERPASPERERLAAAPASRPPAP